MQNEPILGDIFRYSATGSSIKKPVFMRVCGQFEASDQKIRLSPNPYRISIQWSGDPHLPMHDLSPTKSRQIPSSPPPRNLAARPHQALRSGGRHHRQKWHKKGGGGAGSRLRAAGLRVLQDGAAAWAGGPQGDDVRECGPRRMAARPPLVGRSDGS